jgi:hypothetical protein
MLWRDQQPYGHAVRNPAVAVNLEPSGEELLMPCHRGIMVMVGSVNFIEKLLQIALAQ